jgi:vitamin B12 transporter
LRISRVVSIVLLLLTAAAAEITIKVVDPQSAAVSGAQVLVLVNGKSAPVTLINTSAEGIAVLPIAPGKYHVRVFAQGFAPQELSISAAEQAVTVKLRLATASETVVVTGTRTLVAEQDSGAPVSTLSAHELEVMHPVAAADALRFLPGTVVETAGQRGGLASLFVRGGDSRYNKVIVDGVPITDPGGTFDFGVVPLQQADRLELLRGAQSTLYGSDAMTSVVQVWSRTGSAPIPELRFGADGGNFETAEGYASLAGARGRFDYNLFGDQFNTSGQGVNDEYSNSSQGANLGVAFSNRAALRFRIQHSNNRTGVQSFWDFNGQRLLPPDSDQFARQNNLLASLQLTISSGSRWQHRFSGFEYNHRRSNVEFGTDQNDRISPLFGPIDTPFSAIANINRAGFEYQGDYVERSWAHTTLGYQFEDENAFVGDTIPAPPVIDHGLRRNHALYSQQALVLGRLSVIAGARFVHNESFGNRGVPRIALALQALRGGDFFSGTRLRFSFATGIKESRFEEAFASGPFTIPNLNLKPEQNRAFEAGIEQRLLSGKYELSATYFNNLFTHQIDFSCCDSLGRGQFVNVNKSKAHGAEVELHGRPLNRFSWNAAYNYVSTQILEQPFAFDPLLQPGQPLLHRPKHSGSVLLNYITRRWAANLGTTLVGRRPDSDFEGFGFTHAAGYARVDLGGWCALTSRVTAYLNLENVLNNHYNEVVGFPALGANFRAGMRFRLGGE